MVLRRAKWAIVGGVACWTLGCGAEPQTPTVPVSEPVVAKPAETSEAFAFAVAEPPPPDNVLWQAGTDLDGDGVEERVELRSKDGLAAVSPAAPEPRINVPLTDCGKEGPCELRIVVGNSQYSLFAERGSFGGVGLFVIDVQPNDGTKEILLIRRTTEPEDPPYVFTVITFDGALHANDLWHSDGYSSGHALVPGDGTIIVEYDDCPDAFTVRYSLRNGVLAEVERKTARRHPPGDCAG